MSEAFAEPSPFLPSPVVPATLEGHAPLQFRCRPGIACWNAVMDENVYMVQKWNEFVAA